MIDYREILRLDSLGYSRRRISSMVNSSHHTVEDTLKAAHDTGIAWPLEDDVTNAELQGILFPWKYVSSCGDWIRPARTPRFFNFGHLSSTINICIIIMYYAKSSP